MSHFSLRSIILSCVLFLASCQEPAQQSLLWEKTTIQFSGPELKEAPETFLDFALTVTFQHEESGKSLTVPGYFAADGNASESGAVHGTIWQVNWIPDEVGNWTYTVSFKTGKGIAISDNPEKGESAGFMDRESGIFRIKGNREEDSNSRDFAKRGMLRYTGERYLQFSGDEGFFLKGGAGSPENFLAYSGFDGTYDEGGTHFPALGDNQLHDYIPHAGDWREGDPSWQNGKGTEIIGAINYLAGKGLNAAYILTMNVEGDGQDLWPWTASDERFVFDVSKLAQWEIVFDHMDDMGIVKDLLLTETENESLFEALDGGGSFADSRKLYYREMIARFGHCLGLSWNLGEENGHDGTGEEPYKHPVTTDQMKEFAAWIHALDPYDHHIVVHNWPGDENKIFGPLLGNPHIGGLSLQEDQDYYGTVTEWIERSDSAGRTWIVAVDEPLGWEYGLRPDEEAPDHDLARTTVLWPVLMAGGAGVDWYFGWQNNAPTSDLSNEDWRSRNNMWEQTKIALDFFTDHVDLADFQPLPELRDSAVTYMAGLGDNGYLIYSTDVRNLYPDLPPTDQRMEVRWFDPKNGGALQRGTIEWVDPSPETDVGSPPGNLNQDWILLLTKSAP